MRRFILGWKAPGHTRRFRSEIVNYAGDFCVLGKAPAADMLAAVERLMAALKLPINEGKTRCLRCPEEPFEFLGYRIGRNYRPHGKGTYIGTRPGKASVQSICRRVSGMTAREHEWRSADRAKRGEIDPCVSGCRARAGMAEKVADGLEATSLVDQPLCCRMSNRMRCRTADGGTWTTVKVRELREQMCIAEFDPRTRQETISVGATARRLGICIASVHRLIRAGALPATQLMPCAPWQVPTRRAKVKRFR